MLRPSVLSLAVAAAIATPAFSQQVGNIEQHQQTAVQLAPITVSSSREDSPLNKLANNIAVLNENTLAENFATSAEDALETLPGVSFDGNGRYGLTDVTIRGISENRVKILVDGQEINSATGINGPWQNSGRQYMDLSNIKQVEVIKGPASSLHGASALGGVVSFVSKTPDDYLADGKTFGGSLFAQYSGDNRGFNFNATAAFAPSAQWDGLISFGYGSNDERKNHHGNDAVGIARTSPDPQDNEHKNFQGQLRFKPTENHIFTLAAGTYQSNSQTDILSARGIDAMTRMDYLDYKGDDELSRHHISIRHDFTLNQAWADSGYWKVHWQEQSSQQETFMQEARGPRYRDSRFKTEDFGVEAQFNKSIAGDIQQNWVYGFQYTDRDVSIQRFGVDNLMGAPTFTHAKDAPDSSVREIGIFAQNRLTFGDSGFSLIPGLRYDHYQLTPHPDNIFYNSGANYQPREIREGKFSFRLGALYDLNDNHTLYANYAEGFRAPDFKETNLAFSNNRMRYAFKPNPNLKAETSRGFELGWRSDNGIFHHDFAVFYNRYKNFILDRDNGTPDGTGYTIFTSTNLPSVEIYGAELNARIDFAGLHPNLEGFSGDLALAYAKGKERDSGKPVNAIEPFSGHLGLQYDAPNEQWGLATKFHFATGKNEKDIYNTTAASPARANTILPVGGYGVVDITGYYQPIKDLTLRAGVFNVFDKNYISWKDAKNLDSLGRLRYSAPDRWFGASIRYDF